MIQLFALIFLPILYGLVLLEKDNNRLRKENAGLHKLLKPQDERKELDVYRGNDTRPPATQLPRCGMRQH